MNTCEEIRELLARNHLSPDQKEKIEKHLKHCRACSEFQQALNASAKDLRDLRKLLPPPHVRTFFLSRVEEERKERKKRIPRMLWQSPLGVVAASIFLLIVLVIIYNGVFRSLPPDEPAILLQVFPAGRVEATVHPSWDRLLHERGSILSVHLVLTPEGRVEKILTLEGGSENLRESYRKLLPGWTFNVPGGGDYLLVITVPEPLDK